MSLLDPKRRRIAYNDDRNDYDETPFIAHVFDESGTYFVLLAQYRGPRGFRFGTNSAYALRVSKLPSLRYAAPLGVRVGSKTKIRLGGSAQTSIEGVYLTEVRAAEYAPTIYPYTMPTTPATLLGCRPTQPDTSMPPKECPIRFTGRAGL